MGLFSFLGGASGNINTLVEEARQTKGAVIVDVRTPSEFSQGHIKGAHNIPLDRIDAITKVVTDKSTPLYLCCASGARSGNACRYLNGQGYENVQNMGGIGSWRGETVKGSK